MKERERDELIDALLDQEISESDFLRLEAEMHVDPEARQTYYDRLKLDSTLQIAAESGGGKNDGTGSIISGGSQAKFGWLGWAGAFAFALLAGTIGWKIGQDNESYHSTREEPVASGFGAVSEQSNAVWELNRGDLLPQGEIVLESGIAQLELFSGVELIVEGPAAFEILSTMEMSVNRGKVRTQTPDLARGFRVRLPHGELVDMGTEFALDVAPGHSDIHVLDGELEWHPVSQPMRTLAAGESLRWKADGEADPVDGGVSRFTEAESEMARGRDRRKIEWGEFSRELRGDRRLLAYFPMDQRGSWNGTVFDESAAKRNGTIVRAKRAEGRFENKLGMDFTATGSRVRVEIPGDHDSLTLMCWVKIVSLDRWYNSLFLTDGHELHEPHWQIMDDGRLFFSVKANEPGKKGKDKHIAFSPPVWTPAQSGKWLHLATVFNGGAMTITHYRNGKAISTDEIPEKMQPEKVRIGAASIGNWSDPTRGNAPKFAVRNLNGTIDEFAIFSAPLNAEEIREIYEAGKP